MRPSRLELWVARADGSEPRQVTRLGAANFAPYFHPDGRRIIFASNQPNPRSRNFDLYLVNLDGSGLERVTTSPEFDAFPMFSPDGKRLVFASNRNAAQAGRDEHLHRGLGGVNAGPPPQSHAAGSAAYPIRGSTCSAASTRPQKNRTSDRR